MRCKTCDYPLWNLTTRTCPECGERFYPSDFEFTVNAVRFQCPQCRQTYYGTGANGHLEPRAFDCVSCHRRISMDEMVLLPAEGVDERETLAVSNPWTERDRGERVRPWLRTVGLALFNPTRLGRAVRREGSLGQAWWFAILTAVVVGIGAMLPWMALAFIPMIAAPGGAGGPAALSFLLLTFVMLPIGAVISTLVSVGLWALLAHGLLRLTGSTAGTLGRTVRAIAYSSGANVCSAVPCLGGYVGWIWWVVSAVVTVKEAHEVRGLRATFAVAGPPVILVTLVVIAYAMFIGALIAMGGAGAMTSSRLTSASNTAQVSAVRAALMDAAAQSGAPKHALELWLDDRLATHDYVAWQTATTTDDIPVGTTTLTAVLFADKLAQREAVALSAAALPAGVAAHRVGDFVFTYHAIDLGDPDPGLWVVVMAVDPAVEGTPRDTDFVLVATAGGQVRTLTYKALRDTELPAQNRHRAQLGLGPLPDPATLLHRPGAPAVEPDGAGP